MDQVDLMKLLDRFGSKKFIAFIVVAIFFSRGLVEQDLFETVLWVYIGGQSIVDTVKELKRK